jgi:hypothetical protein
MSFKELNGRGIRAIKVIIDPATFPEWCRQNGHKLDAKARAVYGSLKACEASQA